MTAPEKHEYYLTFHRFQQSREKAFGPSISKALNSQFNQVISLIKSDAGIPLLKVSAAPVHNALKPLYLDSIVYGAKVRAYVNRQKARMPIGFNERMIQLMLTYFETDILNVSQGITETTKDLIANILGEAALYGYGIDWQVEQIEKLKAINYARSRAIARTETVTAANQAGRFAAQDTGLLFKKEWLSTLDFRTRKHHITVNGNVVGMDDYFNLGEGVTMLQPGARVQQNGLKVPAKEVVNCRCTALYLPQRNAAGKIIEA